MRVGLTAIAHDGPRISLVTRGLAAHDHPELTLIVRADLVPPPQMHWLADRLAAPVFEAGERWSDGETTRAGWTHLRFRAEGATLAVEAWDFASQAWVPEVTGLLAPLGAMNDVLDRTGTLEHSRYPWGEQLATWAVEDPRGVVLATRDQPQGDDSGWRFFTNGPARAASRPLWEIAAEAPWLVGLLALPPGSRAQAFGGRVDVVADPSGAETRM